MRFFSVRVPSSVFFFSGFEQGHSVSYKSAMCAQLKLRSACAFAQSDQSLRRHYLLAKNTKRLQADSEDSDQLARMGRLI